LFASDATFCVRTGLSGGGSSLESYNFPGRFIRHIGSEVYIANSSLANPWDSPGSFAADATWSPTVPWWRSGFDLPVNQSHSLQVVTPGFTNRYLRHTNSLGVTEVVTSTSDAALKADATFIIRPGLADSSCYSFESRNFAGQYLRHANFRIRKDPRDGTALFDLDATFCAQPGRYGSGEVTLASLNIGAHNIRHYSAEVWIASNGGPSAYDNPASYDPDVTWHLAAAWTP
jgi:hypothetical protein